MEDLQNLPMSGKKQQTIPSYCSYTLYVLVWLGFCCWFLTGFWGGFGFFVFMEYLSGNKEEDAVFVFFFAVVFLFNASINCKFWCGCTVRSGWS